MTLTIVGSPLAAGFDPSVVVDVPGPVRAAASFLLVLAFGTALLRRRGPAVERAVDRTVEGSPVAVIYGVMAFVLVGFAGGYIISQAARVGVSGSFLPWLVVVGVGAGVTVLAAFGYTVIGTWLTEVEGARRPWPGVVVGAALSSLPWLVLTPLTAVLLWMAVAAVGIGTPTRIWVHGERTLETEMQR